MEKKMFKKIPPKNSEKPVLNLSDAVRYSGSRYLCMYLGVFETGDAILFNAVEGIFLGDLSHCVKAEGYWTHVE